jgi:hypothetical protein
MEFSRLSHVAARLRNAIVRHAPVLVLSKQDHDLLHKVVQVVVSREEKRKRDAAYAATRRGQSPFFAALTREGLLDFYGRSIIV